MRIMRHKVKNKRHRQKTFCLLVCSFTGLLFISIFSASAQHVSATIDREKILIGEAVTLTLKAENINATVAPVRQWFNLPDSINHLEVTARAAIDTLNINGSIVYTQTLTLTSFDSGRWKLPAMQLLLQSEDGKTSVKPLLTDSLYIDVLPVNVSALQEYHPIKDIIEVEVKTDYTRILAIIAGIILLAALVYFIIKQNKKIKPAVQPAKSKISLFEDAIAQLEALQKQDLPNVLFYTRLDEICRNYIQQQLHVRALHLTQDEIMIQLNVFLQDKDQRTQFYQLLRLINAVKFAKYAPPQTQQQQAISTAKTIIQQIHYHTQRPTVPNASKLV